MPPPTWSSSASGPRGSTAAFSAAEAGSDVLVTERTGGPRGGGRARRGHRVPRRGHPDSDGLRIRGQPRGHVPLHDGGLRPGPRRGQDRRATARRASATSTGSWPGASRSRHLLRGDLHGADGHRGPRVLRRRGRLPVQRDRPARHPGATSPGRSGLDGLAAHAAPGRPPRRRRRRRRFSADTRVDRLDRRRPARVVGVQVAARFGQSPRRSGPAAACRPDRRGLHLQRRHAAAALHPSPSCGARARWAPRPTTGGGIRDGPGHRRRGAQHVRRRGCRCRSRRPGR